jgi:hypothetical protein
MTKRSEKPRAGKMRSHGLRQPASKKVRAKSKATVGRKSHAGVARAPLDGFIVESMRVLGIAIEPQWLPAIRMNLEMTLRQGALVDSFPLPGGAEPAPVFEA